MDLIGPAGWLYERVGHWGVSLFVLLIVLYWMYAVDRYKETRPKPEPPQVAKPAEAQASPVPAPDVAKQSVPHREESKMPAPPAPNSEAPKQTSSAPKYSQTISPGGIGVQGDGANLNLNIVQDQTIRALAVRARVTYTVAETHEVLSFQSASRAASLNTDDGSLELRPASSTITIEHLGTTTVRRTMLFEATGASGLIGQPMEALKRVRGISVPALVAGPSSRAYQRVEQIELSFAINGEWGAPATVPIAQPYGAATRYLQIQTNFGGQPPRDE